MYALLEYEASILVDIHHESSLLVLADGLGMDAIIYNTLKLHSNPYNLVLVSNYRLPEARFLTGILKKDGIVHSPGVITAEVNSKDRETIYKQGGVVFVSSRILVVDLLMERMPASLVSGVLILRAHELHEGCQESFALRLLRERSPQLFIKAFSDNSLSLISSYNNAERVMIQLGISKLVLWPRFNIQVVSCLNESQPEVDEIRVKLTSDMVTCQSCILDLMKASLKELCDQNPTLNTDDLTLEKALLPNFESLISLYVDPLWNQLSSVSRRLIGDIASLRCLLRLLIEGDAVSFLTNIEGLRQAALSSLGLTQKDSISSYSRSALKGYPSWFFMNQADRLLSSARSRVYDDYGKKSLNVEISPKWIALTELLKEIYTKTVDQTLSKTILILVGRENTARYLERYLQDGMSSFKTFLVQTSDLPELQSYKIVQKSSKRTDPKLVESSLTTLTQMYKQNRFGESNENDDDGASSSNENCTIENTEKTKDSNNNHHLPLGCREIYIHPSLLVSSNIRTANSLKVIMRVAPTFSGDENGQFCSSVKDNQDESNYFVQLYGYRLSYILDILQPNYVILYEPKVSWVRELEVYNARRLIQHVSKSDSSSNTGEFDNNLPSLKIYFMLYENSVEEQRYLTSLRKEKEAFESLIQLSSTIVIPKDATIPCGQLYPDDNQTASRVIVDMREFRSELPALLHRKGLKVEPMTLSIADYILAPHLCIERKSVSDLVGSLNSGRLFHQATAMSRHYASPVLLIEFSSFNKVSNRNHGSTIGFHKKEAIGFTLYAGRHEINPSSEFNSYHLLAKLVLLTIHFPNLRIFWSMTPYCTAELFAEIKLGRPEPTVEKLPQDGDHLEDHNVEAVDMLLKLPGISWKNYRRIMNHVSSLYDLVDCSLERLTEILDSSECAVKLHSFLHSKCRDLITNASSSSNIADESSKYQNKRKARLNLAASVKTRAKKSCGLMKM
ncbi:hypothetical protein MN116_001156 [Schistosoma mekongi]|uniref:DNA repair endonuclease XPF n=1 Tax=Schistosoma mekongi TaxID=38744 RepID=A0AAE2D8Y8_SCHME|nr:hypothetical protein MN116_001156 [Schistosoma mekongi]